MKTPTPRHASWLAILIVLASLFAACTAPSGGGAPGGPAGSDAPAGSGEPVPTDDYGY